MSILHGYGTSWQAGSRLITYGAVCLVWRNVLRRETKLVLPAPAIPITIKHTGLFDSKWMAEAESANELTASLVLVI